MPHCTVAAADKILDKPLKVLDKGFVRLVDYLGDDSRIVAAARVSYGVGTKTFREDRGLIQYLLRNEHTSPFEQVVFTFHAKLPVFVARQWIRHRTARVNEISGRYSVMKDEFYVPRADDVALQSSDNKQGRSSAPVPKALQKKVRDALARGQKQAYTEYEKLLGDNIARELARVNLPLSLYTEWYWQIDLNNLFHFLKLRLDEHAQMEIRVYAEAIHRLARTVCPLAFEAFDEYVRGSVTFSHTEMVVLRGLLQGKAVVEIGDKQRARFAAKIGFDPRPVK
jgi:thymidylate synthase (FAD)